ncbi:MAG: thioredoxin family protein [Pseudomonadota bacterium]|nr:thioredoxin family protein [Pseudomonadota bacterium]
MAFSSIMEELGSLAPSFSLPNTNPNAGKPVVSLEDFAGSPALLVAFICNHCPYVIHIRESFSVFAAEYQDRGLGVVAICSNDVTTHPDDGPEKMTAEAVGHGFPFPYLHDEAQDVAKAYRAACTPDFFLYDDALKLVYRGQYDASRPNNDSPIDGHALRAATDEVLGGQAITANQIPSMGCNIKWKSGQEPDYFPS